MRTSIVQWLLLVGALLVLVALAVARQQAQQAGYSFYSSYDTGPHGYRALYDVLGEYGVPVRRFEREIGNLDPDVTTLIVSDNTPEQTLGLAGNGFDKNDSQRIHLFVQHGGRLIVLAKALPAGLKDAFPIKKIAWHAGTLHKPVGKGDLTIVRSPDLFSNAQLDKGDNARLAFTLLANHGPVAFDERVHGYDQAKSMWEALPKPVHVAVWIACAMVLLWLVESNVRFVPPTPLDPPDERDSSSYIGSMAELMRRARAGAAVIAGFYQDAKRRGMRERDARYTKWMSDLEHLDNVGAASTPPDALVLRAARIAAQLRKEYG